MSRKFYTWFTCCLFALLTVLPQSVTADELTVNTGTKTDGNVPVYSMKASNYNHTQFIILSDSLAAVEGQDITAFTFHASVANKSWGNASFEVRLMEVEDAAFATTTFADVSNATLVYSGALSVVTKQMSLTFSRTFAYNGGNLLVDVQQPVKGTASTAVNFYGVAQTGGSLGGTASTSSLDAITPKLKAFSPKVTLSYQAPASCPKPTDLIISDVTSNSATLSWTAGGSETSWDVSIDGGSTKTAVSSRTKTFTNLTPSTTYTVQLRAICGANDYSEVATITFKTTAEATVVGDLFTTDFSNEADNAEWQFVNGENVNAWVVDTAANSGEGAGKALYISNDGGEHNAYTVGSACFSWAYRTLALAAGDYSLSFDWRAMAEGTYDGMLAYLVPASVELNAVSGTGWPSLDGLTINNSQPTVEAAAEKGIFVFGATAASTYSWFSRASEWQNSPLYAITIPADGTYNLCFGWRDDSSGGTNPPAAVDNIRIAKKLCGDLKNISISGRTAASVVVSWSPLTGAGAELIVLPDTVVFDKDNLSAYTIQSVAADTFAVVSGLNADSSYKVYARSVCGADAKGEWSEGVLFTTRCAALTAIPYRESFENVASGAGNLPGCWIYPISGSTSPYVYQYSSGAYQGSKMLYFPSSGVTGASERMVALPEISADLSNARIRFWYRQGTADANSPSLIFGTMTDPDDASTFTAIETLEKTSVYSMYEKELAGIPSGVLAIKYAGGTTATAAYIDTLIIDQVPTCYEPKSINITDDNVTATAAFFDWEENPRNQGSPAGYVVTVMHGDSLWVDKAFASSNEFVLTGLKPATAYSNVQVSIASVCAVGDTSEVFTGSLSFTTKCQTISTFPMSENFDGLNAEDEGDITGQLLPLCWNSINTSSTGYSIYPSLVANTDLAYSGSNVLYFLSRYNASTNYDPKDEYAILPEMSSLENKRIKFMTRKEEDTDVADYEVGVMTDPSDVSTFVSVASKTIASTSYEQVIVPFTSYTGSGNYIAIKMPAAAVEGYSCVVIDDIVVEDIPSCLDPTNVSATLTPGYGTIATLSWSAGANESAWIVEYDTHADFSEAVSVNASDSTIQLTGLTAEAMYYARVKSVCSASEESPWSNTITFTPTNAVSLIVNRGTATSSVVPVYGLWTDNSSKSQILIPADSLSTLHWADIRKLVFYSSNENVSWGAAQFEVYITETSATSLSSLVAWNSMEKVKNAGSLSISGYQMEITLDNPYTYQGGNLLIGINQTASGSYVSSTWLGVSSSGITLGGYGSSISAQSFSPKMSIHYTPGEEPTCLKPTGLEVSAVTSEGATLSWNGIDGAWKYAIALATEDVPAAEAFIATSDSSVVLTGLNENSSYVFYLRQDCGNDGVSDVISASFHTTQLPADPNNFSDDFESGNSWLFVNGSIANAWCYGEAAHNGSGTHALYISNDAGVSNAYNVSSSAVVYATKSFNFPDGSYVFQYDWRANGESTYDYLRVALVPDSIKLTAGTSLPSGMDTINLPAGWISLDGNYKRNLSSTWQSFSDEISVAAGIYKVVLVWKNDGSAGEQTPAAVDNFRITRSVCGMPSAVTLAGLTSSSASFTWSGDVDNYLLKVYAASTLQDSAVIAANQLPYTISNLQANQNYAYTFVVKSLCDGGAESSERRTTLTLHTPCDLLPASSIPYAEGFEGVTTGSSVYNMPDCWTPNTGSSGLYVIANGNSTYAHGGTKCLRFYGGGSSPRIAVLPGMEPDLNTLQISLLYKHTSSYVGDSYASLTVGVMSNPEDTSTFVALQTLDKVSNYDSVTVLLTQAPADCHYIALRYAGGTSAYGYAYVDDIEVAPLPECPQPVDIIVSSVSTSSAELSWTPSGSERSWGVQLYQDTTLVEYRQVSQPTVSYTDLEEKTSYVLKVSALCSATDSSELAVKAFRTIGVVLPLPYISGFEDDADNAKWGIISSTGQNKWAFGAATNNGGSKAMYVSNDNGTSNSYSKSANSRSLIYKSFHFEAGEYTLSFDWKCDGESGYTNYDGMSVFLIPATADIDNAAVTTSSITIDGQSITTSSPTISNTKGWIPLINPQTPSATSSWFGEESSWQVGQSFSLAFDEDVNYHLVFVWFNDGSSGDDPAAAVDNLMIAKKLCGDMGAISQTAVTTTSASFAWEAVAEAIRYEYVVLSGSEDLNAKTPVAVNGTAVTAGGLVHSSYYTIYVRAICSEGEGAWRSLAFQTECDPIDYTSDTETGLQFDFEDMPAANINEVICWDTICPQGSLSNTWRVSTTKHGGNAGAYFSGASAGKSSVLVTPSFYMPLDEQELLAYVKGSSTSVAADSVIFWINESPSLDGAVLLGYVVPESDWKVFNTRLPEEATGFISAYILIQTYSTHSVYLDDITIHDAPECAPVMAENIFVDSISADGVRIKWVPGASETNWDVLYEIEAASISDGTSISGTPELWIEGLNASTAYSLNITIVAKCDDAEADPVEKTLSFLTSCVAVTEFPWSENFNDITSGIPVCWDNSEGTSSSSYAWNYYETGYDGACMRFESYYNTSGKTSVLATPIIALPSNPVQLKFYCKNPTGGDFNVSISVAGGARQVLLSDLTGISTWTEQEVDLSEYAGQSIQLFFNGTSNYGSGDAYLYLDNVTIAPVALCKPTKNAGVKNITKNSATIYWEESTTAGDYYVTVMDGNEALVNNQLVQDTFLVISDLTPSRAYDLEVLITTDCGNGEVSYPLVKTISFATQCEAIAVPWSENFESMTSGEFSQICWNNEHVSGAGSQLFKVSTSTTGTNSTHQLQLPDMSSGTITRLTLPAMIIPEANAYAFKFDIYRNNSTYSENTIYEGIRVFAQYEGLDSEIELAFVPRQYTVANSAIPAEDAVGWYNYELTLPNAGVCNIILQGESQYCTSTYMDNLSVILLPTCHQPSKVRLVEQTANSASFAWLSNADTCSVKVYNDTTLLAETIVAMANLPFVIDTLQPNTSYSFRFVVKGICGAEDESEETSSAISVNTPCEAIVINDQDWWKEDFDSLTSGIPGCWSNDEGTTTSTSYKWGYYATGKQGKCVRFNSNSNSRGYTNVLATPVLSLPETPAQLEFWCKNPTGGDFSIAVAAVGGERDTLLSDLTSISNWTLQKVILAEYAGQDIQIFFCATSNYAYGDAYIYLDSVAIKAAPNCLPVKNIELFSLTDEEVVFTWGQNGHETMWDVVVTDNLHQNAVLFNDSVDARNVSILLESNTKYSMHVSVTAHCGAGNLSDAVSADFTFRSPLSEDLIRAIDNNTIDTIDLSDPAEQAKWTILGADEPNHFIFATIDDNAGLYISDDNASWHYNTGSRSASIAYRAIGVPEDNTPLEVSFMWQANGESTVDFGRAFVAGVDAEMAISNHQPMINNVSVDASNTITGIYSINNGASAKLNGVSDARLLTDNGALLDKGTYFIVFVWRNNFVDGEQNPLGIYDLKIWNKKGYDPTAVDNITGEGAEVQKILLNGQVYILRDGVIYSILGTMVR